MKLHELPKITDRKKKRIGRGYGSGKGGHTVGRGAKGLKARGKVPLLFTGTKMRKSFVRRIPFLRGKGRFKPQSPKPEIVNVEELNNLRKGSVVTLDRLIEEGLVDKSAKKIGVKILGRGKLEKEMKVEVPVSKGAEEKIKKAGGEIVK